MELISAKTILARGKTSEWFGADYNMNLYRGCCHGCIYCDSRSDCYQVEDFDRVRLKKNALQILESELRKKRRKGVVGIGAMSDTYNPFERKLNITRGALKLLERFGFGVSLETKSSLVERDVDILRNITGRGSAIIKLTITTADDALARKIEPNVCPSSERFMAVKKLADAGIFTGVLFTPVLPYITDTETNVREIVRRSAGNGARFVYSIFGVTLRDNQRDYYYEQLEHRLPGLKKQYMRRYANRYNCSPPNVRRLYEVFKVECEKEGLLYRMEDIISAYKKPEEKTEQLSLF